jgi:hypothetical protein
MLPTLGQQQASIMSTDWGRRIESKMLEVEEILAASLMAELDTKGVQGAVVEFGIYTRRLA